MHSQPVTVCLVTSSSEVASMPTVTLNRIFSTSQHRSTSWSFNCLWASSAERNVRSRTSIRYVKPCSSWRSRGLGQTSTAQFHTPPSSRILLFRECFRRRSFQPVDCNIIGRVKSLHSTPMKLAYWTLVYDVRHCLHRPTLALVRWWGRGGDGVMIMITMSVNLHSA